MVPKDGVVKKRSSQRGSAPPVGQKKEPPEDPVATKGAARLASTGGPPTATAPNLWDSDPRPDPEWERVVRVVEARVGVWRRRDEWDEAAGGVAAGSQFPFHRSIGNLPLVSAAVDPSPSDQNALLLVEWSQLFEVGEARGRYLASSFSGHPPRLAMATRFPPTT